MDDTVRPQEDSGGELRGEVEDVVGAVRVVIEGAHRLRLAHGGRRNLHRGHQARQPGRLLRLPRMAEVSERHPVSAHATQASSTLLAWSARTHGTQTTQRYAAHAPMPCRRRNMQRVDAPGKRIQDRDIDSSSGHCVDFDVDPKISTPSLILPTASATLLKTCSVTSFQEQTSLCPCSVPQASHCTWSACKPTVAMFLQAAALTRLCWHGQRRHCCSFGP